MYKKLGYVLTPPVLFFGSTLSYYYMNKSKIDINSEEFFRATSIKYNNGERYKRVQLYEYDRLVMVTLKLCAESKTTEGHLFLEKYKITNNYINFLMTLPGLKSVTSSTMLYLMSHDKSTTNGYRCDKAEVIKIEDLLYPTSNQISTYNTVTAKYDGQRVYEIGKQVESQFWESNLGWPTSAGLFYSLHKNN